MTSCSGLRIQNLLPLSICKLHCFWPSRVLVFNLGYVYEDSGGTCCIQNKIVNYFSTLKMEIVLFYETLIASYLSTLRHLAEKSNFNSAVF